MINNIFLTTYVNISTADNLKDINGISFKKFFKTIRIWIKVFKLVFYNKWNTVYITLSPFGFSFYKDSILVIICKLFRVSRIIIHIHGQGIQKKAFDNRIYKFMYKCIFDDTTLIVLSDKLKDDVSEVHHGPKYVLSNGLADVFATNECFKHKSENKTTIQILFLANLLYSKGIINFIKVVALVSLRTKKNIKAVIVGAERDISYTSLKKELISANISNITFVKGPLYDLDKYNMLSESDIMFYPTKNDAFPLVLIEAMQMSLPIISTSVGGIPDMIVDGDTGFVTSDEDLENMADKLLLLIENDDLRTFMGDKSRLNYENKYTIEKFENKLCEILKM